jgi:hypothetical protein
MVKSPYTFGFMFQVVMFSPATSASEYLALLPNDEYHFNPMLDTFFSKSSRYGTNYRYFDCDPESLKKVNDSSSIHSTYLTQPPATTSQLRIVSIDIIIHRASGITVGDVTNAVLERTKPEYSVMDDPMAEIVELTPRRPLVEPGTYCRIRLQCSAVRKGD